MVVVDSAPESSTAQMGALFSSKANLIQVRK
jgi:hypothetical protein